MSQPPLSQNFKDRQDLNSLNDQLDTLNCSIDEAEGALETVELLLSATHKLHNEALRLEGLSEEVACDFGSNIKVKPLMKNYASMMDKSTNATGALHTQKRNLEESIKELKKLINEKEREISRFGKVR